MNKKSSKIGEALIMYGQIYKKLRTKQNILQKDAAKNIVSDSLLSNWENGKTDITFEKFVKLINRINLTPEEFFKLAKIAKPSTVVEKIEILYMGKRTKELKELTLKKIELYKKRRSINDLYLAVIACNYYYDLSGENLLIEKYQQKLVKKLSDIEVWTKKYISIFGNSITLLSSKNIYGISSLIITNWDEFSLWGDINNDGVAIFNIATHSLLNAANVLIKRKEYRYAKKLLEKIQKLTFNRDFLYIELRRKFLSELLNYKLGQHSSIAELNKIIETANYLNQRETAYEFINDIKKIDV